MGGREIFLEHPRLRCGMHGLGIWLVGWKSMQSSTSYPAGVPS